MSTPRDQFKSSYGAFTARERELARSRERRDALESDTSGAALALPEQIVTLRDRAEAAGWTSLAIEHDGPARPVRLVGIPPGGGARREVPELAEADAS